MFSGYLGLAHARAVFHRGRPIHQLADSESDRCGDYSFGLLILLYVISWPAQDGSGIVSSVLTYLSLPTHFSTMTRGVIDTSDIVYFSLA